MFRHRTQPKTCQATLYVVVFGSVYIKVAAFVLLGFVFLQPVGQVFAASDEVVGTDESQTEDQADTKPESETAAEPVSEPESEPEAEPVEESVKSDETAEDTPSDGSVTDTDAVAETATETETEADVETEATGQSSEADTDAAANDEESELTTEADVGGEATTEFVTTSDNTDSQTTPTDETVDKAIADGETTTEASETAADSTDTSADSSQTETNTNASEGTDESAGTETEATADDAELNQVDSDAATEETIGENTVMTGGGTATDDPVPVVAGAATSSSNTASTTGVAISSTTASTSSTGDQSNETISESTADTTEQTPNTDPEVVVESDQSDTSEDSGTDEDTAVDQTTASPTPATAEALEPNENGVYVIDNSFYSFDQTECVSVGDGSFYCSEATPSTASTEEPVYAAFDADGDHEIFLRTDNGTVQITSNQTEDRAPQYDAVADQVVWHRLSGGRYQIMQYDVATGETVTLSDATTNNMEPMQADGVVVWQRWVENNWEVMLFDGSDTVQISDNPAHDVAPAVRDGYVIWHTTDDRGEKLLSVYEIATGIASNIADPDGGHVENPRFVLVYDTTFENGDRVTKQYDPKTGAITPVGSDPVDPPALPDPEPTGETTALVQTKPTTREEGSETNEPTPTTGTGADGATSTSTVSNATSSVGVTTSTEPITDVVVTDAATGTDDVLPLSDYDLIIEPYDATSSTQAANSASTSSSVE